MFQPRLADITIYNVKSHVQSRQRVFLPHAGRPKLGETLCKCSCVTPSKHTVPSEGEVLKLVLEHFRVGGLLDVHFI